MYPGELVAEHLRLVRKLGEGGLGSVWVADHLNLETQVAVKFVHLELVGHAEAHARFQREATSAAKINSPHVVRVLDHGLTQAGIPYIAMELLAGEDLGTIIRERAPLQPGFVRVLVTQACKGLGKAHALGIVHRDIKPENIFVSDEGGDPFVRLLDFGVAKQTLNKELGLTASGTMMGTPYYMSPEQAISAKQVDFRSDLWSLAVVAYHGLTGKRPFEAETLGELCVKLNEARFEPATLVRNELPPSLDAWFERALARQPDARFGSAKEMADAFTLAAGASVPARYLQATRQIEPAATAADRPDTIANAASVLRRAQTRRSSAVVGTVLGLVVLAGIAVAGVWLRRTPVPQSAASAVQLSAMQSAPSATPVSASAAPASPSPSPSIVKIEDLPLASASASSAPAPHPVASPSIKAPSIGNVKGKSTGPANTPNKKNTSAASVGSSPAPAAPASTAPKKDRGF
jgi:serine/threonine protein kinase